jgi:multidrug efflux pump subunit AcrA (membrane-fusion protein)
MLAQFKELWKNHRQRLTYLLVTASLLGVLQIGHQTHWHLSLTHGEALAKSPRTEGVSTDGTSLPAAPQANAPAAKIPTEIQLADAAVEKAGIVLERAALQPMREVVVANGVTSYNQDAVAQLSVRVPGHVWRVEKRVGQEIAKGDCLAVIDAAAVGEAKTELLKAMVDHELKANLLSRLEGVANEVAERSLRQAEADARAAHLRVLSAQQKLINLGLPLKPEELTGLNDQELNERLCFLGIPESIRRSLDAHATTANLLPITAPFDGVVIGRNAVVGEVVSPEKAEFVIADVTRCWILLDVRKEDAGRVRRGQTVEFDVDGVAVPLVGRVEWISTEMDEQTRTLSVRAEVANPPTENGASGGERLLKANTFGTGRIVLCEKEEAVVVPVAAVHRDAQGRFVFVRQENRFVRRNVSLGVAVGDDCEIAAGLAAGEIVAAAGSHVLEAELTALAAE